MTAWWCGRSTGSDAPPWESLNTAKDLDERGVHIVITTLGIDLKTPGGAPNMSSPGLSMLG
jgi:hypothetical protein